MTSGPASTVSERAFKAAIARAGISVLHLNQEHRFDLAENLPLTWPVGTTVGKTISEVFPGELSQDFENAVKDSHKAGSGQTVSFHLGADAERRHFQAHLVPDETGTIVTVSDVTDQHAREIALASLLREVSHRSKNLLAIVQSVAMQTAHHSGGIKEFLDKFRGRLHALSSTQDLVTESNWRGSQFKSLVSSQLARIGQIASTNVAISGENPLLGPNASLHIGLAIHELAANAALHGALSGATPGTIQINAHVVGSPAEFVFEWRETAYGGPPPLPPRFGSLVLQRIVPLSVGGTAELDIGPAGVFYRLQVPASQFEQ